MVISPVSAIDDYRLVTHLTSAILHHPSYIIHHTSSLFLLPSAISHHPSINLNLHHHYSPYSGSCHYPPYHPQMLGQSYACCHNCSIHESGKMLTSDFMILSHLPADLLHLQSQPYQAAGMTLHFEFLSALAHTPAYSCSDMRARATPQPI